MKKTIALLLDSMTKHDASLLPMSDRYRATENGVPAAVRHMTCWRTIQKVNCIAHEVYDTVRGQAVVVAQVDEGGYPSLLAARIRLEAEKITELELYLLRSRAESGFWYAPGALSELPDNWHTPIPEDGRATRDELTALGESIFAPPQGMPYRCAPKTYGMENGGPVFEHIAYLSAVSPEGAPTFDPALVPESGRISLEMPIVFPGPVDPKSRILAVDEEQGIVVVSGMVDGFVSPYITPDEVSTCFVPMGMIESHRKMLTDELTAGHALLDEMPSTAMVVTLIRYHSGKVYGYHQIIVQRNYGSKSPWVK